MKIAISEIPREGLEFEQDADPAALDLTEAGAEFPTPIHVRSRWVPADRVVCLSGEIAADVRLQCRRCLESFPHRLDLSFRMQLEPQEHETGEPAGALHELQPEELDTHTYSGDAVDDAELIREQILLALPAYPLCRTDCRGLCPRCGLNLNQASCRCAADEADRPLSKFQESLKKIIKKQPRRR